MPVTEAPCSIVAGWEKEAIRLAERQRIVEALRQEAKRWQQMKLEYGDRTGENFTAGACEALRAFADRLEKGEVDGPA